MMTISKPDNSSNKSNREVGSYALLPTKYTCTEYVHRLINNGGGVELFIKQQCQLTI